jgi:hypothetical protein
LGKKNKKGERKFNGKTMHLTASGSKSNMKKEAKQWRSAGYNARVVKGKSKTKLYVGKKSGKSIHRKR